MLETVRGAVRRLYKISICAFQCDYLSIFIHTVTAVVSVKSPAESTEDVLLDSSEMPEGKEGPLSKKRKSSVTSKRKQFARGSEQETSLSQGKRRQSGKTSSKEGRRGSESQAAATKAKRRPSLKSTRSKSKPQARSRESETAVEEKETEISLAAVDTSEELRPEQELDATAAGRTDRGAADSAAVGRKEGRERRKTKRARGAKESLVDKERKVLKTASGSTVAPEAEGSRSLASDQFGGEPSAARPSPEEEPDTMAATADVARTPAEEGREEKEQREAYQPPSSPVSLEARDVASSASSLSVKSVKQRVGEEREGMQLAEGVSQETAPVQGSAEGRADLMQPDRPVSIEASMEAARIRQGWKVTKRKDSQEVGEPESTERGVIEDIEAYLMAEKTDLEELMTAQAALEGQQSVSSGEDVRPKPIGHVTSKGKLIKFKTTAAAKPSKRGSDGAQAERMVTTKLSKILQIKQVDTPGSGKGPETMYVAKTSKTHHQPYLPPPPLPLMKITGLQDDLPKPWTPRREKKPVLSTEGPETSGEELLPETMFPMPSAVYTGGTPRAGVAHEPLAVYYRQHRAVKRPQEDEDTADTTPRVISVEPAGAQLDSSVGVATPVSPGDTLTVGGEPQGPEETQPKTPEDGHRPGTQQDTVAQERKTPTLQLELFPARVSSPAPSTVETDIRKIRKPEYRLGQPWSSLEDESQLRVYGHFIKDFGKKAEPHPPPRKYRKRVICRLEPLQMQDLPAWTSVFFVTSKKEEEGEGPPEEHNTYAKPRYLKLVLELVAVVRDKIKPLDVSKRAIRGKQIKGVHVDSERLLPSPRSVSQDSCVDTSLKDARPFYDRWGRVLPHYLTPQQLRGRRIPPPLLRCLHLEAENRGLTSQPPFDAEAAPCPPPREAPVPTSGKYYEHVRRGRASPPSTSGKGSLATSPERELLSLHFEKPCAGTEVTVVPLDRTGKTAGTPPIRPGQHTPEEAFFRYHMRQIEERALPSAQRSLPAIQGKHPGTQQAAPGFQGKQPGTQQAAPGFQGKQSGTQQAAPGFQGKQPGSQQAVPGFQGGHRARSRLQHTLPTIHSRPQAPPTTPLPLTRDRDSRTPLTCFLGPQRMSPTPVVEEEEAGLPPVSPIMGSPPRRTSPRQPSPHRAEVESIMAAIRLTRRSSTFAAFRRDRWKLAGRQLDQQGADEAQLRVTPSSSCVRRFPTTRQPWSGRAMDLSSFTMTAGADHTHMPSATGQALDTRDVKVQDELASTLAGLKAKYGPAIKIAYIRGTHGKGIVGVSAELGLLLHGACYLAFGRDFFIFFIGSS